jgi:hypothetical protein
MKFLRASLLGTLSLLGLSSGAAGPARAAVEVEVVWISTTGDGITGGASIGAEEGDQLVAEIRITPDAGGVSAYGISLEFDTDLKNELSLVSVTELLPTGMQFNLTTEDAASTQESSSSTKGHVLTIEAEALTTPGPTSGTFAVAHVTFDVTANVASDGDDVFTGSFGQQDGVGDNANQLVAPVFKDAAVNGLATHARLFRVAGTSSGDPWSWRIAFGSITTAFALDVGPVPSGGNARQFATAFVNSINANTGTSGCVASQFPAFLRSFFIVFCPSTFDFFVADPNGVTNECEVSGTIGGSGCEFNPTIFEEAIPVPALSPTARIAAVAALILLAGLLLRRRSAWTPPRS